MSTFFIVLWSWSSHHWLRCVGIKISHKFASRDLIESTEKTEEWSEISPGIFRNSRYPEYFNELSCLLPQQLMARFLSFYGIGRLSKWCSTLDSTLWGDGRRRGKIWKRMKVFPSQWWVWSSISRLFPSFSPICWWYGRKRMPKMEIFFRHNHQFLLHSWHQIVESPCSIQQSHTPSILGSTFTELLE